MNITFLVGNGFDVNLGLKTNYKDFYPVYIESNKNLSEESCIKKFCNQIEADYDTWSDFERAFGKHAKGTYQEIGEIIADFNDKFAEYLKVQCEQCDYGLEKQSESEMKAFVMEPYKFLERRDEQMLRDFYQARQKEIHTYNFISFNYTDTLDKLLMEEARKSFPLNTSGYANVYNPILHLHGSIEEGYIIIGIDSLEQFDAEEMKKNTRLGRHCVKNIINNQNGYRSKEEKFVQLVQNSNIICVYGMAFGETDRSRWTVIYEWLKKRKENKLIIFKYNPGFDKLNRMSKGLLLDAIDSARDEYLNILGFEDELEKMYEQVFVADSAKVLKFKLIANQESDEDGSLK